MLKLGETLVLGLAARRGTEAWLEDTITEPARIAFVNWCLKGGRKRQALTALTECAFCAGFWLSGLTYATYVAATRRKAKPLDHLLSLWAVAGVQALAQKGVQWIDEQEETDE